MHRILSVIVLFLVLSVARLSAAEAFTLEKLGQLTVCEPEVALEKIDSLQEASDYPLYKLEILRAQACFHLAQFNQSLKILKKVQNMVGLKNDHQAYRYVLAKLSEAAVLSYDLGTFFECMVRGKKYAQEKHCDVLMANLLVNEGLMYRTIGMNKMAYESTLKALEILSANTAGGLMMLFTMSKAYDVLMFYYISDNNLAEASRIGYKRNDVLRMIAGKSGMTYKLDIHVGYHSSKMALLSYLKGSERLADDYYDKFRQTDFSSSIWGRTEINGYLLKRNENRRVLDNVSFFMEKSEKRDTLNILYTRLMHHLCRAYENTGDYKSALDALKRAGSLERRLRKNYQTDIMLNENELKEIIDRDSSAMLTENKLVMYRIYFIILGSVTLLFFLILLMFSYKSISGKLHLGRERHGRQTDPQPVYAPAPEKTPSSPKTEEIGANAVPVASVAVSVPEERKPETDEEYFSRFDEIVRSREYFLNPSMTRDDFAKIMMLDKNRFAVVMKRYAGMNMTAYINNLRLEYSLDLFRECPEMSVNEVAQKSGIPNVSTFYRLFKEKYGTSPNDYRNRMKENEN